MLAACHTPYDNLGDYKLQHLGHKVACGQRSSLQTQTPRRRSGLPTATGPVQSQLNLPQVEPRHTRSCELPSWSAVGMNLREVFRPPATLHTPCQLPCVSLTPSGDGDIIPVRHLGTSERAPPSPGNRPRRIECQTTKNRKWEACAVSC